MILDFIEAYYTTYWIFLLAIVFAFWLSTATIGMIVLEARGDPKSIEKVVNFTAGCVAALVAVMTLPVLLILMPIVCAYVIGSMIRRRRRKTAAVIYFK